MTLEQIKSTIEESASLIGHFITGSVDIQQGSYSRYYCEYVINLSPDYTTTLTFIAHGVDGDYTLDKNFEGNLYSIRQADMETDTRDYLEGKVLSEEIYAWDDLIVGNENPNMSYAKVYIGTSGSVTPQAWVLARDGENLSHLETTFDEFPLLEEINL